MKWTDTYILLLSSGNQSTTHLEIAEALLYKTRYGTPSGKCFAVKNMVAGFSPLSKNCLAHSTMQSKIIILSHSIPDAIQVGTHILNYLQFALFLQNNLGLRQAGILSFKGCSLGGGTFLDNFKEVLGAMRIGYLLAYLGDASPKTFGDHIVHMTCGEEDLTIRQNSNGTDKLPDTQRVKVVKGNYPTLPPIPSARFN